VLGLLFGQPDRRFSVTELIALAGAGSGAVQREVRRLAQSGLVSVTPLAGRKFYQANHQAPVFEELRGLVDKTVGVPRQVQAALEPAADRIRFAVLHGSIAKGTDRASSDIDVLLVSDELGLDEVFSLLESVEQRLGRKLSPAIYTSSEFPERRRGLHPFLTKVLAGKHHVLLGSEDAIEGA
jgi:predicted nucleotidyltransferase